MIDISKIKVGDEVVVRGRVKTENSGEWMILEGSPASWVSQEHVIEHIPAPVAFKVGDRVMTRSGNVGTVVYVRNKTAWITFGDCDGDDHLYSVASLQCA